MPEPTDHRAEAEDWTQDAKIHFIQAALRNADGDLIGFDPKLMRGAKVAAFIGIGHALLAGLPQPVKLSQNLDTRCPWWTDGDSWAVRPEPLAKRRCELAAGHEGDHR